MGRLRIRNFGPITSGLDGDGFMELAKATLLIGNQGTGKSSIAKLFSTCCWLEKALFQQRVSIKHAQEGNRFMEEYCAFHRLNDYFREDTEIAYVGAAYAFQYNKRVLRISETHGEAGYQVPKIAYVPSDRNVLAAIEDINNVRHLPLAFVSFATQWNIAQRDAKTPVALPVGNARFEYERDTKSAWVSGKYGDGMEYRIRLSDASSGYQSFVPLYIVSRYLAMSIGQPPDPSVSELTIQEWAQMEQMKGVVLADETLGLEARLQALQSITARFKNHSFLNIVEEPEQNLFPDSQKELLYALLGFANLGAGNQLLLTTHSPYVINHLTLAIKGAQILPAIKGSPRRDELLARLAAIVPLAAAVGFKDVRIYEMHLDGRISTLGLPYGLPSDENMLNALMEEGNNLFMDMLDINREAA